MNFLNKNYNLNIGFSLIICLFAILAFSSYLIPLFVAFLYSDIFTFANAWDEEAYFTLQAAESLLTVPGYMASSSVVYVLHHLGLSGAMQNFLFDFIVLPFAAFFAYLSCLNLGVSKTRSLIYVLLIFFSSVLFNYANPYVAEFYGARHLSLIMPGFESYPSILRSPQPQLSYLLISLAVFLWSKNKRWLWLLFPLPFLYFFVAMGYCFVIGVILVTSILPSTKERFFFGSSLRSIALWGMIFYLLGSLVFVIGAYLVELLTGNTLLEMFSSAYNESRDFNIPLAFTGLLPFIAFIFCQCARGKEVGVEGVVFLYVSLCILLVANVHILGGYTLSYKNIHDYAISAMVGVALSLFFESCFKYGLINSKLVMGLQIILLSFAVSFTAKSQGFKWEELRFRVFVGQQISEAESELIQKDPLRAGVSSRNLSAKLSYAYAGLNILPFSYQYYFFPYDKSNLDQAMEAARLKYPAGSPQLVFFGKMYGSILKRGTPLPTEQSHVSPIEDYFFIEPKGSPFVYFP